GHTPVPDENGSPGKAPRFGVAYFGDKDEDIDEIARVANWIVLPMTEADTDAGGEQVKRLVARAHAGGLKVWLDPWRVGDVFAGAAEPSMAKDFPDQRQVASDGHARGSISPLSPAFHKFMLTWLDTAQSVGADGVFWDEPHTWTSRDGHSY